MAWLLLADCCWLIMFWYMDSIDDDGEPTEAIAPVEAPLLGCIIDWYFCIIADIDGDAEADAPAKDDDPYMDDDGMAEPSLAWIFSCSFCCSICCIEDAYAEAPAFDPLPDDDA